MKKVPGWMSRIILHQGVATPNEDGSRTIAYMDKTYLAKEEDGETIVCWT